MKEKIVVAAEIGSVKLSKEERSQIRKTLTNVLKLYIKTKDKQPKSSDYKKETTRYRGELEGYSF